MFCARVRPCCLPYRRINNSQFLYILKYLCCIVCYLIVVLSLFSFRFINGKYCVLYIYVYLHLYAIAIYIPSLCIASNQKDDLKYTQLAY